MGFNARIKYNQKSISATAVTAVAAGSTVGTAATNVLNCANFAPGYGVVCYVSMVVKTSSLTLAPKWQGSNDGTNWEDIFTVNSAANVATAAGTGSNVTTTRAVMLPAPPPYKYARLVFVTGGATAHATDDTYALKYHWVQAD